MLRALPRETAKALGRHDLALFAGGVTFYAALAFVPLVIVATRLAGLVAGQDRVRGLVMEASQALPSALGADEFAELMLGWALDVSWVVVVVCILPASVYGEGLRRAYAALGDVDEKMLGWRGRLAALPLLVVAPLLLLAVLAITPALNSLFSAGTGGTVLGIYLALNVDWVVVSLPLAFSYRVVAPQQTPWRVALAAGFTAGAFVAGFLQGIVLFLSLPFDLGAPFGGLTAVGALSALLLWLWVLHLVVLTGFVGMRTAVRLHRGRRAVAASSAAQIPVVDRG